MAGVDSASRPCPGLHELLCQGVNSPPILEGIFEAVGKKAAGHQQRGSLWTGALVEEKPLHSALNTHGKDETRAKELGVNGRP